MRTEDHPFAERLRIVPPAEAASWAIGQADVSEVSAVQRKAAFTSVGRDILKTDRERRKYGLSVDTGGAIRRALEWAFKAGVAFGQGKFPAVKPRMTPAKALAHAACIAEHDGPRAIEILREVGYELVPIATDRSSK